MQRTAVAFDTVSARTVTCAGVVFLGGRARWGLGTGIILGSATRAVFTATSALSIGCILKYSVLVDPFGGAGGVTGAHLELVE